jgi:hypothetical protein
MRFRWPLPRVVVLALLPACLPQHSWQTSAPPVEKGVAFIEADPAVRAALGEDASVSLLVTSDFERDWFDKKLRGRDSVHLLTTVSGSRGEATLSLDALNLDEQGWSGRFEVRAPGRRVLRDGAYVSEGDAVLVSGTFTPDGSPVVTPPAP